MKKYLNLMSCKTKLKCIGVLLLTMLSSVLASIWPVHLGNIYTDISNNEITSVHQCLSTVLMFGLIYLAAESITIFRRVLLDCVIASHESEVRENTIEKLLKMPISYYGGGKLSGERTAQLNQGVAGLSQLIKICCNDIFATVLTAICTLFQVATNAPFTIAAIMMGYLIITVMVSVLQIRSQNGIREDIVAQKNGLDGQICQSISNLELIRSMDAGEYEIDRLKPSILKISSTEKKHHRYMGTFDCVKQFCKITFQVIILIVSVVMIVKHYMAPGAVITVCLLFQQLIKPIDEVYRFMDETASSVVKARVLDNIAKADIDTAFKIKSGKKEAVKGEIILKDTIIMDPSGKEIVKYDNLTIPCNSVVAVIGDSGCGKSSLMKCLTRYFVHGSHSTISILGSNIDTYSQKELIDTLLYVPQKGFFFADTIRENLMYGLSDKVSDKELIVALRSVCLYDSLVATVLDKNFVAADGIDKMVLDYAIGEGGTGLSGGEGQRLSLARVFLRRPKAFVFDESTTGLDGNTAEKVLFNIEEYAKNIGAGIIYISHDDRVVNRCKYVIKLDNQLKFANK
ncbi:MAG: ABC transporter transmembrane domain-containing protein [Mediterraneibacter faecis]